jgi:glycosyltransferase involved in cell wall biosynthesis
MTTPAAGAPRYWLALHPDLRKPIGGAKQMHRLAEALTACGRMATLIQDRADFHPGWFHSQVQTVARADWLQRSDLSPQRDLVVLPETFLPALPRYAPGLPKLVFNQNGAYSFGFMSGDGFPADPAEVLDLYRHPDLLHVLCISQHDQQLLQEGFGLGPDRVSRLVNAIETDCFCPAGAKRPLLTYMPRKNGRDAAIVAALLQRQPWFAGWQVLPIHGLPQRKVARLLQQSMGFLAFGHPEGFGLPLAEAAACGCALIGYSGLGGRELLRRAAAHGVGWEVGFGDWQGFLSGVQGLQRRFKADSGALAQALQQLSAEVRAAYHADAMLKTVARALPLWESKLRT